MTGPTLFKDVEIVEASVESIDELGLFDELQSEIKNSYDWWLKEGPQESDKSGAIPPNAAKSLLACLNSHQRLELFEIKSAINSKRSDVRDLAITIMAELCTTDENLFRTSLNEIERGDLSARVLDELKKGHLSFCIAHIDDFIKLLDSENQRVKISAIKVLGNKTMKTEIVEKRLRALLESEQVEVRENALRSLRYLETR